MKKYLIFILIIALFCPVHASAAERPKYVALIFEGCPQELESLLPGLESRRARVTFFLSREELWAEETLVKNGHQLGFLSATGPELSRREIAGEFNALSRQTKSRVRLLRSLTDGSDGLRQVARALGFSFVAPTANLRALSTASDGDILLADSKMAPISLLEMVNDLQKQDFRLVTVSELARLRGVSLRPGAVYHSFPPKG